MDVYDPVGCTITHLGVLILTYNQCSEWGRRSFRYLLSNCVSLISNRFF